MRLELCSSQLCSYHRPYSSPYNKAALWTETCPDLAGVEAQFTVWWCTLRWAIGCKWATEEVLVGRIFFGYVTFCFLGRDQEAARQAQLSLESLVLAWVPVVMFLLFSFPNPHIVFQSPEAMLQLGSDFNGNSFISLSLNLSLFYFLKDIFVNVDHFYFFPFLKSLFNLWQHCFCSVF